MIIMTLIQWCYAECLYAKCRSANGTGGNSKTLYSLRHF